jgi:hypothetical protein
MLEVNHLCNSPKLTTQLAQFNLLQESLKFFHNVQYHVVLYYIETLRVYKFVSTILNI